MVDMCGHLSLVALILGQTGGHLATALRTLSIMLQPKLRPFLKAVNPVATISLSLVQHRIQVKPSPSGPQVLQGRYRDIPRHSSVLTMQRRYTRWPIQMQLQHQHLAASLSIGTVNNLAGAISEVPRLRWQLHSSTPTSIHRSGIYLAGELFISGSIASCTRYSMEIRNSIPPIQRMHLAAPEQHMRS